MLQRRRESCDPVKNKDLNTEGAEAATPYMTPTPHPYLEMAFDLGLKALGSLKHKSEEHKMENKDSYRFVCVFVRVQINIFRWLYLFKVRQ